MNDRKKGRQVLFPILNKRGETETISVTINLEKGAVILCVFAKEGSSENNIEYAVSIPPQEAEEMGRILQRLGCAAASTSESK